nr:TPA_asm: movement protein [Rhododendron ophiovirus]
MSSIQRVSAVKSSNGKVKAKNIGKLSAAIATQDLMKSGIKTVISMKDMGDVSPEIECLAAEFAAISKGEIHTLMSPMTLRMKKDEIEKGLSLGSLSSILNAAKKISGGTLGQHKPFVRFDKIQCLYFNLGKKTQGEIDYNVIEKGQPGGTIEIQLVDEGYDDDEESVIDSTLIRADSMSLNELSMEYFVRAADMNKIKLRCIAEGIKITNRDYGSMMVIFYVHEDFNSASFKKKSSTTLYLDELDRPIDINSKTVFSQLGDAVQSSVMKKKASFKKIKREEKKYLNKKMKSVAIKDENEEDEFDQESIDEEDNRSQMSADLSSLMKPKVASSEAVISIENSNMKMLDTGAPGHLFYKPNIVTDKVMRNVGGVSDLPYKVFPRVRVRLGKNEVILTETEITTADMGFDLVSLAALKREGLVDKLTIQKEVGLLYLNGEICWELSVDDAGKLVF